ncbi:hypothetical protein DT075_01485 [Bacillus licheniformis]|nr:hypothetical protein DT075_01485 [Bacillus licheniformis]
MNVLAYGTYKDYNAAKRLNVRFAELDRELIDAAPGLRYIMKFGAGIDNIDVEYANEKGILVTNAPGQNASAVADLAFGLLLSGARSIPQSRLNGGELLVKVLLTLNGLFYRAAPRLRERVERLGAEFAFLDSNRLTRQDLLTHIKDVHIYIAGVEKDARQYFKYLQSTAFNQPAKLSKNHVS